MLGETMKALNFSQTQIKTREYLGGERGEDDATGITYKYRLHALFVKQ
jgi:hypothetical protein